MEQYKWKVYGFKIHLNNSNTAEVTLFTLSSLSQYWIETKHKAFQAQRRFLRKLQVPIFPVYSACLGKLHCLRQHQAPSHGIKEQRCEVIKGAPGPACKQEGWLHPRSSRAGTWMQNLCPRQAGRAAAPEPHSHCSPFLSSADTSSAFLPHPGLELGLGKECRREMSFLSAWQISLGDVDACGAARTAVWDMARSPAPELRGCSPVLWQDPCSELKLRSEPQTTAPNVGTPG